MQKQAKKLEEEVARTENGRPEVTRSGLGADLQPVPEPMVRDLSVPPARSTKVTARIAKPAEPLPVIDAAAVEGEVIPAAEIKAATSEGIRQVASLLRRILLSPLRQASRQQRLDRESPPRSRP